MIPAIQIIFILFFPALIIYLNKKYKKAWLSPIVFCYLAGIVVGNLNLPLNLKVSENIYNISVLLAIPILLFTSDFLGWLKHSKKTFISFFLGVLAVVLASTLAFLIFHNKIEDSWKLSGMMIGVYTGGTPNMSAIGIGLDVGGEEFALLNAGDIIFSSLYFLFIITFAKKILSRWLPEFKPLSSEKSGPDDNAIQESFYSISGKEKFASVGFNLLTALVILGISLGLTSLIMGSMNPPFIIFLITTLGLAASFIKPVHNLKGSYVIAEYLLLIFAVAIGTSANFREIVTESSDIIFFVGIVVATSVILHFIFVLIARIDPDTFLITSVAGIFGPAFVGPVADALKNPQIVVPGIAMGLLGYAIGNYLGLTVAFMLSNFF